MGLATPSALFAGLGAFGLPLIANSVTWTFRTTLPFLQSENLTCCIVSLKNEQFFGPLLYRKIGKILNDDDQYLHY